AVVLSWPPSRPGLARGAVSQVDSPARALCPLDPDATIALFVAVQAKSSHSRAYDSVGRLAPLVGRARGTRWRTAGRPYFTSSSQGADDEPIPVGLEFLHESGPERRRTRSDHRRYQRRVAEPPRAY